MTQPQNTVRLRHAESLYHALGPLISEALARPDVVEVMANPDGSLWVDRAGVGREKLGRIEASAAETTIRLLASHMGETVTPDRPIHANSAADALRRIEDLVGEASQIIPKRSIASAVNLLVFIERTNAQPGRMVRSIVEVQGFGDDYIFNESKATREP